MRGICNPNILQKWSTIQPVLLNEERIVMQQGVRDQNNFLSMIRNPLSPSRLFLIGDTPKFLPMMIIVNKTVDAEPLGETGKRVFGYSLQSYIGLGKNQKVSRYPISQLRILPYRARAIVCKRVRELCGVFVGQLRILI
ncbi:MAG: hypothetical protein A2X46_05095 [Lentisphaerae bacterium GWF2_57_35]|nr:MAG: hypothetical protein A2X46_05095 [Lentisphaerae bacterium GWF2_57_35]